MRARLASLALLLPASLVACGEPASGYEWDLPPGFPEPRVPESNPMSDEKVELGRFLFYDTRLSGNQTQSCGSCHAQDRAFTDGMAVSTGSTGDHTPRGSMSLANIAYVPVLTWANPAVTALEDQALVPMFGEDPVELGLSGMEADLVARLRASSDPDYAAMFSAAFPGEADPISVTNVVRAIASFERTMLSGNSPYDRYTYRGDATAMSASALRGRDLFFSERMDCFHCHGGFAFSDSVDHAGLPLPEGGFHNTGLYNVDGRGGYPAGGRGLYEHTTSPRDMGRFRAPTLRNIVLTAPYMHDGSIATLDEVIDHYAAGGRTIPDGEPNAGIGSDSPLKSVFMHGFELTAEERADVMAFFDALTDDQFLTDERFSDPFDR